MDVLMKKIHIIALFPILFYYPQSQAIELSKHLSTSTKPVPKFRVAPKYPKGAAQASREGWAQFSFIIEEDGSVSNVISTDDSGSKDMTLAAKNAVLKWKFEPALENGKPVQQCVNSVQLDFKMNEGGTKTVTRRFKSLYTKTQEAFDKKDYIKVEEYLANFKKIKYMHLSENNFLQLLHAEYAKVQGDEALQLTHLYKVRFSSKGEDSAQALSVLDQRFILEVKLNLLKQAYKTFKAIEKIPASKHYLARYQKIIKRVDEYVNSAADFMVSADIRDNEYWQYALARNEFTLSNIDGKLSKMDIRCANKRHVYSIESNNTWKLPESWQHCHIFVFGENNTTFNVTEHPFKV
jgi:TonB family protein